MEQPPDGESRKNSDLEEIIRKAREAQQEEDRLLEERLSRELAISPEEIESLIESKLEELYSCNELVELEGVLADEWYDVEMEAKTGKHRRKALKRLGQFIEKLKSLKEGQD